MLYTQTITPETFGLLKKLQSEPALGASCLTGTMALALHLGHRACRNAELLLPEVFSWELLEELLRDKYGFQGSRENDGLRGRMGQTELFLHEQRHTLVSRPVEEEGLRLCGLGDLAARTLSEIEMDGTWEASFAVLACLSARMSLNAMLRCYERKYPSSNVVGAVKALLYFNDIEQDKEPLQMHGYEYTWEATAVRIWEMVDAPDEVFEAYPFPQRLEEPAEKRVPGDGMLGRKRCRKKAL